MGRSCWLKTLSLALLFFPFVWLSSLHGCRANRASSWKRNPTTTLPKKDIRMQPPATVPVPAAGNEGGSTFDVRSYGAKGDGTTDDTEAFQSAWAAACNVEASTMLVPAGHDFVVGPISFAGPSCQPNIVFQLDGGILAPTNPGAWGSGLLQWLEFTKLRGITVQGQGVVDGRGEAWWGSSTQSYDPMINEMLHAGMPGTRPTALKFYGSTNVTVTGITIRNSPQCHLKFDTCNMVAVYNITISSPGNSPNTDGIHLQNSVDVVVHHSNLACGDDCISIQTGCSHIRVHDINCGPGHGISIGGLGRDNTQACVNNVTVRDSVLQGTLTGVRIKTWQGGSGLVQNVQFLNIQVSEVQSPIVIDQFYCNGGSSCRNQSGAVALAGIRYQGVQGTYTVTPARLACSDDVPCTDVILNDVQLQPVQESYHMYDAFCWQAFGELETPTKPPIDCLMGGKPSNRLQSDYASC